MRSAELPARPDADVVTALRMGDEEAFGALVERYSPTLMAVAMRYVPSRSVAEEVLQETWIALLRGIDDFEERSSLKTWLFRIMINIAMSRSRGERRSVPFSCVGGRDGDPTVDPERFVEDAQERWHGHWSAAPRSWDDLPENRLLARETLDSVWRAIDDLPERQQHVLVLRDVDGWSSEEVCDALGLSLGNQRVLLHRARAKVRDAVEREIDGVPA